MNIIHGFELCGEETIAELQTVARTYRHVQTGAALISMINHDENKVFGIAFRTPPTDSTGIAHIMEHAVLGGSQKYPLKEPFVQLIKGSLKTFLNAMTYPDKTVYPVASTNTQDFYNLVDVYLDAVFHPLITPNHLAQEGWHYELEKTDAPLTFKGVVYNEMKGAYSSPDSLLYRQSSRSLFPDNAYGFDSGGDPAEIPNLTYAQFAHFHATYYHPSNARIFFYGDDDPTERLRLLDAQLRQFQPIAVNGIVALQPPFAAPKTFVYPYGADAAATTPQKSMVQLNWLLPEGDDPDLMMGLSILSYALLGMAASPLRKRLMDTGLGEDVTGGGLSTGRRQMTFAVGLKGVEPAAVDQVEPLILAALTDLAQTGLTNDMVEAALNTMEFSLRENNTGSYPRGLSLFFRMLTTWLYEHDPLMLLRYEAPLAKLKARLQTDSRYWQSLIQHYLLDNPHRTTVTLTPDVTYNQQLEAAEKERLAQARSQMDTEALQQVMTTAQTLKAFQEREDPPEALAALPMLTLHDLEPKVKTIPNEVSALGDGQLLYHDLFTNGILYLTLGFNLHALRQDLLPYIHLFGRALTEMGTDKEDFVELQQRIGRKTGGIGHSVLLGESRHQPETNAWFLVSGKSTVAQTPDLLAILRDILLTVKLDDRERFRQIVLKAKARNESGLIPSGHSVVSGRLRAAFTEADWLDEEMGGINYLFFLRRLATEVESDWPAVLHKLEEVRRALLNRTGMICNVTLDRENWRQVQPQVAEFVARLPAAVQPHPLWTPTFDRSHEGLVVAAQVNYVGKGANLYELGYQYHGSSSVITNFIRTSWLWDKIRMQGGAYGAYCTFGRQSGVLTFLSYRDPNLLNTLAVYDQTAQILRNTQLSAQELTRNIIGSIGAMDGYQLPDAKGYTAMVRHLLGESDAERQQIRDEVLRTTLADFRTFADVLDAAKQQGSVVVMGPQSALEAVNAERPGWLRLTKVM
ncbi:MAG: insulinase family protein [Caldilineaceae bacterium]|nr:insulinase family protein [Caldilineaceae bacterium]